MNEQPDLNGEESSEKKEILFDANLLTNFEKTINLMEAIEISKNWLKDQEDMNRGSDRPVKNTLEWVMEWLKLDDPNKEEAVILYGFGGGNRYQVFSDGRVMIMTNFCSDSRSENIARVLHFPSVK